MAHFDLFVIGGGSGGVACARRAASYGAKVGIAEDSRFGGTCVIRGCVPKKLMHYSAHFAEMFEAAPSYGWEIGEPRLDFRRFLEARNAEIARLNGIYIKMLQEAGVQIFAAKARVASARGDRIHAVEVLGERHTATRVLIAVGAKPFRPDIEGIELAVTSDEVLETVYDRPSRVVVVGAGYIGVELSSILNGFGCETHLLFRANEPLRGFDEELRRELSNSMERLGIKLHPGTVVNRLERTADAIGVSASLGTIEADMVVYATGRPPLPRTHGIGLEDLAVRMTRDGSLYVNSAYESNVEGILAVGDCADHAGNGMHAGHHDLTPVAIAEGRAVAERLYNDNVTSVAYETIPTAVFSLPQIGSIGYSEERARELGFDIEIYRARFRPLFHTLTDMAERVMMKLIVDKQTDRVIGCHMIGGEAGEIVQGFAVAMTAGATKAQFDETVALHPTTAEEFVTMYKPG